MSLKYLLMIFIGVSKFNETVKSLSFKPSICWAFIFVNRLEELNSLFEFLYFTSTFLHSF